MEWKEVLRQLKALAWRVLELVVNLVLEKTVKMSEVAKLQVALRDLTKVSEKLDQVIAQGKVPTNKDDVSA